MHTPTLPTKLEHRRFLGAGGMGQVHLVFDRERDEEVALKLLAPLEACDPEQAKLLFKQEYWAMASLRHPNLVAAYDYGELADGTPYLTMEHVPGTDLTVDPEAFLPKEAAARAWLPGVAAALGFLHGQGYMHGDLKPENIRLREDGTPKLMDLGLLTRVGRPAETIRGSLDYLAPEAIRQGAPDGRADLYALGAVLYHVLAGTPPFHADNTLGLLHAHLEQQPVPLRERRPDLSAELTDAVARLMEKSPAARFPTAAALLDALGLPLVGPLPSPRDGTPLDRMGGLLGSPVIGRGQQQEALSALVADPRPGTRWLVGESGSGKTRLLQEARAEALLAGVPALTVRGLGPDAGPYQALRPLLETLIDSTLATTGDDLEVLRKLAPVLLALVPSLGQRLGVEPAPPLEGAQQRLRLQLAVVELVRTRHDHALWLVDDWDQLDVASRDVLSQLRKQGQDRAWRWAIAAADAPADVPQGLILLLMPLGDDEAVDLARALLGQDQLPQPVLDRLLPLSGGLPGAIEAVLGHWLRTGALVSGPGGWSAGPADAFELPGGLRVALDAGFEALDENTRRVARVAAILGPQGDLPWLAALAGEGEAHFFAALQALEAAGVMSVEHSGAGRAFRFARPAQAAVLAATWPEAERRELHGRAARWMARRLGDDPCVPSLPLAGVLEVARHQVLGDAPLAGMPWVMAAIRRALVMFELEAAENLLTRGLALPDLPEADRLQLQIFQANKSRFQGKTDEALAIYRDTRLLERLEEARHPALAQESVSCSVLLYLKSQYAEARAGFERAIATATAPEEAVPYARARIFMGRMLYFQGQVPEAKEHLAAGLAHARKHGLKHQLAASLGFYGYVLAATDPAQAAEGLAMLDESIALNQQLGDPTEANECLDLQGNVFMAAGRFQEARRAFQEVLATADRLGMDLDAVTARLNLGAVMLELGELEQAQTAARQASEAAQRQGRKFPQGFALALEGAALLGLGRPGAGLERLQRGLALAREIGNRYLELNISGLWVPALIELGQYAEAAEALAQGRALATQTQNRELDAKFDRAATALAVLTAPLDPAPDQRQAVETQLAALEAGARAAHDTGAVAHALRWRAAWQLVAGHPLDCQLAVKAALELARPQGLRGLEAELERLWAQSALERAQPAEAREHLQTSLALAEELGARPLVLLNEHLLGSLDHDARRKRDSARALQALNDLPAEYREGYDAVRERAAAIAGAQGSSDEAVSARARDLLDWLAAIDRADMLGDVLEMGVRALVQLAEAERGFLLLFDGIEVTHQAFYGMSSADSDEYSTGLAYEVLYSGQPMITEDVQNSATLGNRASIQALALRAVVGVPLVLDGQTIGTMLADSRRVTPNFGVGLRELVLPLADQIARATARAREREWQRAALAQGALLFDLALATAGKTSLEAYMAPIARAGLELTYAQQAYLLEGPELVCRMAFDAEGQPLPPDTRDLSQSVCRWVYERGEPLYLADAQSSEAFAHQASVMSLGLRAIHAVPVEHDGQQLGVLYVQSRQLGIEDPNALRTLMRMGEMLGAFMAGQGVTAG